MSLESDLNAESTRRLCAQLQTRIALLEKKLDGQDKLNDLMMRIAEVQQETIDRACASLVQNLDLLARTAKALEKATELLDDGDDAGDWWKDA